MKATILLPALALALGTGLVGAPTQVQAADAQHPYQHIDRRNDAGNDTGDSQVDQLNSAQLDENYHPQGQQYPGAGGPPPGMYRPGAPPPR
ncbi:MAG: hypothetical protein JO209_08735 [Acidisphaera sp.]|nr:hypothetical protein [Acidisphaera sp.]